MTETQSEKGPASSGDALPANCEIIEIRVPELRRLFNAIDPSPFHDRDLDPGAEDFIVNWAKEVPRSAELGLRVTLERPRGRTSLAIGLAFLAVSTGLANALEDVNQGARLVAVLREGLLIGGWVAMWRPLEVFLYDWWPIRAQARLYDRLAKMPVRIQYVGEGAPDAWRLDWPAVPASATGGPRPV